MKLIALVATARDVNNLNFPVYNIQVAELHTCALTYCIHNSNSSNTNRDGLPVVNVAE